MAETGGRYRYEMWCEVECDLEVWEPLHRLVDHRFVPLERQQLWQWCDQQVSGCDGEHRLRVVINGHRLDSIGGRLAAGYDILLELKKLEALFREVMVKDK